MIIVTIIIAMPLCSPNYCPSQIGIFSKIFSKKTFYQVIFLIFKPFTDNIGNNIIWIFPIIIDGEEPYNNCDTVLFIRNIKVRWWINLEICDHHLLKLSSHATLLDWAYHDGSFFESEFVFTSIKVPRIVCFFFFFCVEK